MTAPLRAPLAPRLLTDAEAAAYLRLPVARFRRLRLAEVFLGRDVRYDRLALDAHLDALSGLAPNSTPQAAAIPPADNDDPEAALARFQAKHAGR